MGANVSRDGQRKYYLVSSIIWFRMILDPVVKPFKTALIFLEAKYLKIVWESTAVPYE